MSVEDTDQQFHELLRRRDDVTVRRDSETQSFARLEKRARDQETPEERELIEVLQDRDLRIVENEEGFSYFEKDGPYLKFFFEILKRLFQTILFERIREFQIAAEKVRERVRYTDARWIPTTTLLQRLRTADAKDKGLRVSEVCVSVCVSYRHRIAQTSHRICAGGQTHTGAGHPEFCMASGVAGRRARGSRRDEQEIVETHDGQQLCHLQSAVRRVGISSVATQQSQSA